MLFLSRPTTWLDKWLSLSGRGNLRMFLVVLNDTVEH